MPRRTAQYSYADINRIGEWAIKKGLKALIVDLSTGTRITVPLDKDFNVGNQETANPEFDDDFTL